MYSYVFLSIGVVFVFILETYSVHLLAPVYYMRTTSFHLIHLIK